MVGKASEGGLSTSSLTSLVPRQVMLESCSVVAGGGAGGLAEKKTKKRRKGEQEDKKGLPVARAALLRAIAAFLEGSGYARTLAALRSEAQLEIDGGSKSTVLDLEEIICTYLESSKDPVVGSIAAPEEHDAQNGAKEDEGTEESVGKKKKKKTRGADDNVQTESAKFACENGVPSPNQLERKLLKGKVPEVGHETAENQMTECPLESKDQKRKKSKKVSKETNEPVGDEKLLPVVEEKSDKLVPLLENASSLLDESDIKPKEKKKKKKKDKLTPDSACDVINQVGLKASQEEEGKSIESETASQMPTFATGKATSGKPMEEDNSKSKDKKKRKHGQTVEDSSAYSVEVQAGSKSDGGKKGKPMEEDNSKSSDKKKRKHSQTVEDSSAYSVEVQTGSQSDGGKKGKSVRQDAKEDAKISHPKIENISSPNAGNIEKKAKKRKRSASEETELHVDEDNTVQESRQKKIEDLKELKDKEETQKLDHSLLNSDLYTYGKKKKSEKLEDNSEKSTITAVNKQSQVPNDANKTPATGIRQNEMTGQQEINENLGKNEWEGNGLLKSRKAELKRSGEPKTVNAFQRVKIDEVKFADDRLQDNSYWAKSGAEAGYGAKAQEILGQVKGRDFRHEKTKKKRGSYRGGQIDLQSHSVKFQYSDEDE